MEIEKLIEILRGKCAVCKRSSCNGKYWQLSSCPATCEAADAYGVCKKTIMNAIKGKNWKCVKYFPKPPKEEKE